MAAPENHSVIRSLAPLVDNPQKPHIIGKNSSQLLFGETFAVERRQGEWCYGINQSDGYKGYVHQENLVLHSLKPTHYVDVAWAHIYPEPDYKTEPVMGLGMMSRMHVDKVENNYAHIPGHGWIFEQHIAATPAHYDYIQTALLFLGSPYLYGGRSLQGLDCSALVQLSLHRAGLPCPRDTGDQEKALGHAVEGDSQAGDFVFFKGHVGIMLDEMHILNATARTMDVRIESLKDLEKIYNGITAIKRL